MNLSSTHTYMFFSSSFLGAQCVFGLFIITPEQCSLPNVFWASNSYLWTRYVYAITFFHTFDGSFLVMFDVFGLYVTCDFARIFVCLPSFVGT